jgi:hypothetical protein
MNIKILITVFLLTVFCSQDVMAEKILFHRGWDMADAQDYIESMSSLSGISDEYLEIIPMNNRFCVVYSGPLSFEQLHNSYSWVERIQQAKGPVTSSVRKQVLPEVVTRLIMSNSQINRVAAPSGKKVKDVIFSPDRGLTAQIMGSNIFVSFDVMSDPDTGEHLYRIGEAELYVVLEDGTVYPLIIVPKTTHGRTVHLLFQTDRIKKILSSFKGIPFEHKVMTLVKAILSNDIDDRFLKKQENRNISCFDDIGIFLKHSVSIPGEGLVAREFILELKQDIAKQLTEKMFLVPELVTRPVSITLNRCRLERDRPVRLIIVERKNEDI